MARKNYADLQAFVEVALEKSFTKAAAKLGISQSALSHTIRTLEARLRVRLLNRTTRSVSPTDAGQRLVQSIQPHFEEINEALEALSAYRDTPAGTIRLTASSHAARTVIWPKLEQFLPQFPDIKVEVNVNYGLADIVAERFDAGVRLGEMVAKDMIAVRIGPEMRMAVVASPSYLATRDTPQIPADLTQHACINLRLPTYGGLYAWEFEREGEEINVRVDGQLTFNNSTDILISALAGFGLAYVPEDDAKPHVEAGRLLRVLEEWCEPFVGYHIYYPSRRQNSPALMALVAALRT